MFRKLFLLAASAAVLGLAAFWVLTIPATVPASALGPHTPDLANGKTMFLAGDCSACSEAPSTAASSASADAKSASMRSGARSWSPRRTRSSTDRPLPHNSRSFAIRSTRRG